MKLIKLTVLKRNDTHIIAEVNYSVSYLFSRKIIKRKVYRDIKEGFGDYWWYLDTGELFPKSESINAIISTNIQEYNI